MIDEDFKTTIQEEPGIQPQGIAPKKKCPNCGSTKVQVSSYSAWMKCEDCFEVFD